jgi:hypothetical protein
MSIPTTDRIAFGYINSAPKAEVDFFRRLIGGSGGVGKELSQKHNKMVFYSPTGGRRSLPPGEPRLAFPLTLGEFP